MTAIPSERFFSKVQEDPATGCWEWLGARVRGGYGKFFTHKRHNPDGTRSTVLVPAHRWSYEYMVATIPDGLEIDHLCRNKGCVNPAHLEPVTHAENVRRVPQPDSCPSGHEFTPENTAHWKDGLWLVRRCLTCRREAKRRAYYQRKGRKCPT